MKKYNYLLIAALAVICLLGCGKKKKVEIDVEKVIGTDAMNVEYTQSTYVINPDDLSEITTFSPYVFVGEVEKYEKTEYLNGDGNIQKNIEALKVKSDIDEEPENQKSRYDESEKK